MDEESTLIEKAKNGDVHSFEKIISIHQEKIYNLAYRLTGNEPDARDLSQDVIIKVFCSIKNFYGKSTFSTWLWRIIHNTFLDECKSKYRKNSSITTSIETVFNITDDKNQPEKEAEKSDFRRQVKQSLLSIPPKYRMAVVMCDIQGFSYNEIADISRTSIGTVKSRLNRGRELLKKIILESGTFSETNRLT
ncbi:MAG: sigma-70 family RNA polymerase sigma factor [Elusimicrobiota bacterium]